MRSSRVHIIPEDNDYLLALLRRCACRYYPEEREQLCLMKQTIAALTDNFELLLDMSVDRAIFMTMHRLVLANKTLVKKSQSREKRNDQVSMATIH